MTAIPNPLSPTSLNTPTSPTSLNTPTGGETPTQLQVLEEQLAASKAKRDAKATKAANKGKTDNDKENSKPKKKRADGSGSKAVKPEHGKEEKEAIR